MNFQVAIVPTFSWIEAPVTKNKSETSNVSVTSNLPVTDPLNFQLSIIANLLQ